MTVQVYNTGDFAGLLPIFRWILISTTIATVIGAVLLPAFIKLFCKLVESFNVHRSIPKILLRGFSRSGLESLKGTITIPSSRHLLQFKNFGKIPKRLILLNIITSSSNYVAIIASLYAGVLNPALRTTCSTLSSVINSVATILAYIQVLLVPGAELIVIVSKLI